MNRQTLTFYQLRRNPYSPQLPVEALFADESVLRFCSRIVSVLRDPSGPTPRRQPLPNQRLRRVHRQYGTAKVPETIRRPGDQIQSVVRKTEQHNTAIRGQRSARKIDVNPHLPDAPGKWTTEHIILAPCSHGGNPLGPFNCLLLKK